MAKSDIEHVTHGETIQDEGTIMSPVYTGYQDDKVPVDLIAGSKFHHEKSPLEKRLLRKVDMVVLPLAGLTYFIAYLDRNCIGNAKVMGIEVNLGITDAQFYNCLALFFVGYIIMTMPANISARKLKPNRALGGAVMFFGVVLCGMSAAKNYATLLALRILLGLGQGFVPIITMYTSLYYRRDELASRSAIYYSAATVSGAFGGVLSYGIQSNLTLENTGHWPWQWLFLIEGTLAIAIGLLIIVVLPRFPDDLQGRGKKHWLFTAEEIDFAAQRAASYNTEGAKIQLGQIWAAFKDPKTYLFAMCQSSSVTGVGVIGSFLPTFINNFGFSPLRTQLFTIIPYAAAFFVVLFIGIFSDRWNYKGPFMFAAYCTGCLGYIILLCTSNAIAGVVATCLVACGCYGCIIILPVWIAINTGGFTKRGATWAISETCGLSFSIMGTQIYNNPPRFIKGHSIVLGLNVVAAIAAVVNTLWMRHLNKKKDLIEKEYADRGEVHPHIINNASLEDVQDQHISFRYIL